MPPGSPTMKRCTPWAATAVAAIALGSSCRFGPDPEQWRFSCELNSDCGSGYECAPRVNGQRRVCFPIGYCLADCEDPLCAGQACSVTNVTVNCGSLPPDGGLGGPDDAGVPFLRACVPRETICDDGIDN